MRGDKMLDAVGYVDADLIEKAEKAGNRNAVRQAFLRYGAAAASFVLVMGGVFLADKYMADKPPVNSGEVVETGETSETNEIGETETVETETIETESVETDPATKETSGEYENPTSIGGYVPCVHSVLTKSGRVLCSSYHTVPGEFIDYVGTEAFDEWTTVGVEEKRAAYERGEASCRYKTIVEFVEYFDIPREDFFIPR